MTEPTTPPFDFSGNRALVTGGSRGIGAVIAAALARAGAHVFINYSQDDAGASRTCAQIAAEGGTAESAKANLVRPEEIRAMFARVAASGGLDFLVHNAAIGSFKPALDVRPNQWDLTMSVGARALLLCAREAVDLMSPGGGRIVSVSSLGSNRVIPSYGAIGVMKAALESLTRYLGAELAPRGILVNAVTAGLIDGTSVRRHPQYDTLAARAVERTPLGRLGTADDVTRVVLFLCSPLSGWIVGQTLVADGGMSLSL
jgi:enoyl-[acyl-carrier protein] reductase III